jgi:hypothetical protein
MQQLQQGCYSIRTEHVKTRRKRTFFAVAYTDPRNDNPPPDWTPAFAIQHHFFDNAPSDGTISSDREGPKKETAELGDGLQGVVRSLAR